MPTTELPEPPSPDEPARGVKRPYSPEEIKLLTEYMAKPAVNGNLAAAVALLQVEQPNTDWNYNRCYKLIQSNPFLKSYHPARNPDGLVPTDVEAIDREAMLTPLERAEVEAMVKQEKQVAAGDWVALGLSENQANRMLSMEKFAQQPLKAMINTTHGSMMFCLGILLSNFEDTAKRINGCLLPDEFDAEGNPRPKIDVERDWHKVLLEYSKEIRAIKDQVDRGNLMKAKVDQMQNGGGDGPKKKRKGGFGLAPMTVNVQPGGQAAFGINP